MIVSSYQIDSSGDSVDRPDDDEIIATTSEPVIRKAADDPQRMARLCLSRMPPTVTWRDEIFQFTGPAYEPRTVDEIRASASRIIEADFERLAQWEARQQTDPKKPPPKPKKVTRAIKGECLDAIRLETLKPNGLTVPCWLDGRTEPDPATCLVTTSGIVSFSGKSATPTLMKPTPTLFTTNALNFGYDPGATCPQWLAFLDSLWPQDEHCVEALQEIVGYLLHPATWLQKMFWLIGPKRSGKGTIARVIREVIGKANCVAPTLGSLAGPFGLQPLLGRTVAIIGDARLSGRVDSSLIVERLLSITGEDLQTVERKHMASVTDKLPVRFMLISNEMPRLDDASATIASRVVLLQLRRSWYGEEDPRLTDKLLTELPGILNWALAGWQRLLARGYFLQPDSSEAAIAELECLSSPVTAFVRERCETGPNLYTPISDLFGAWKGWCNVKGMNHGTEQTFGRNIAAAVGGLQVTRRRIHGERVRFYEGIQLNADCPSWL